MERLQPVDLKHLASREREELEALPPLKLIRTMAHAPAVLRGFLGHGAAILYETRLDPRWRELVILAVAHHLKSDYEIHEHERIGKEVGCEPEKIAALRDADPERTLAPLSPEEAALVRFARDTLEAGRPSDDCYRAAAAILSEPELVELTACIAFYQAAALFLATFDITPEADDFDGGVPGRR